MTQEEYERRIKEATEAANQAQAERNAADASALSSAITNASQATAQQMSGGVGEKPQYVTEQEQQRNKAAIENAVKQNQTEIKLEQPKQDVATTSFNQSDKGTVDTTAGKRPGAISQPAPNIAETSFENDTKGTVENPGTSTVTDAKIMSDTAKVNAEKEKMFSDIIADYWKQKNMEEEEMRRQEDANMYSSMATGTTELAAGIINMLAVGQLGATHQQYNNPTADWMKKADADMKANRERRRSMADTLQRLKAQEAELKAANRLDEIRLQHSLQKEQEARAIREQERQDKLAQQEWQRQMAEKQLELSKQAQERSDKQTDATIAQRWAQISDSRKANVAAFLEAGYVPDKNSPSGYRYAPEEAKKWANPNATSAKKSSGSSSGSNQDKSLYLPVLDEDGNINFANVRDKEQKELILKAAKAAIKKDLPPEQVKQFEAALNMAPDENTQEEILMEWIGKSKSMQKALREFDPDYKGGTGSSFTGGQMSPDDFISALNS